MLNQDKNKLIFDLLQAALFQKEITLPKDVDWNQILQEMKIQTVAGLPYEWLCSRNVLDAKIKMYWNQIVVFQVSFWVKLMHEQELLIQLMRKNNINMVILKGAAAAIYYPKPDLRTMGDIDFLVNPKEFQKAYHILLENGYQLAYPEDETPHHITLRKNNIVFEIHKSLSIIARNNAGNYGDYLQKLLIKGLSSIEQKKIENWEFPTFPRLQNGIVLLLHVIQHLISGLGLRQIVDWMMFVNSELNDETWRLEFQPILRKIKLEKFAITLTRMCQLHLGLRTEDITWCHSADPLLCNKLLDHFMEKGNFGRKLRRKSIKSGQIIYILSTNRTPLKFFKRLQDSGIHNWKLTKKYSILRPFAWIYQACRYTWKGLNRKHPVQSILSDWRKSKKQVDLLDELKLFDE